MLRTAHSARVFVRRMLGDNRPVHGVRVVLVRSDSAVLLVRHWYAPGVWTLPGGGIKGNETPHAAALREVYEETGYRITKIDSTLGTYRGSLGEGDSVIVVTATLNPEAHGSLKLFPDTEVFERKFFLYTDLPETVSPANRKRLDEYVAGRRDIVGTWG